MTTQSGTEGAVLMLLFRASSGGVTAFVLQRATWRVGVFHALCLGNDRLCLCLCLCPCLATAGATENRLQKRDTKVKRRRPQQATTKRFRGFQANRRDRTHIYVRTLLHLQHKTIIPAENSNNRPNNHETTETAVYRCPGWRAHLR